MAAVIELGHRTSFRLGAVEVRPATCEVIGPAGREALEPRVMQVLVALADARGETVTRDDLTMSCWEGRIVGNDAINRVIAKLRAVAAGVAAGSFWLQTINKVGYRLSEHPPAACAADSTEASSVGADDRPLDMPVDQAISKNTGKWRQLSWAGVVTGVVIAGITWSGTDSGASVSQPERRVSVAASDPAAHDLGLRGRAAVFEGTATQLAQGIGYFKEALARTPDDPKLWGSLAMAQALHIRNAPPAEQAAGALRARQAARRALALDPHEGHALAALANLHPMFRNWAPKEKMILRALAAADLESPAPLMEHVHFLTSTGRTTEALAVVERASRINPLVPWIHAARVNLLVANQRLEEAERAAETATALWPRDHGLWHARFFMFAFNGRPAAALEMVSDRPNWPDGVRESDIALMGRAAEAIRSGAAADADEVIAAYASLAAEGQLYAQQAMRFAAALGRVDESLRFAETLYLDDNRPIIAKRFDAHVQYGQQGEVATAALFITPDSRMWSSPRFMPLMEKIGLLAYWRDVARPDLCDEPVMQVSCSRNGLRDRNIHQKL